MTSWAMPVLGEMLGKAEGNGKDSSRGMYLRLKTSAYITGYRNWVYYSDPTTVMMINGRKPTYEFWRDYTSSPQWKLKQVYN